MSDSLADDVPSPVGKYDKDEFESYSTESFVSYSDEYPGTPRDQQEMLKLPPRLSSTCNQRRVVEDKNQNALFYSSCDKDYIDTSSHSNAFECTKDLSVWEQWLVKKLEEEQEKFQQKKAEIKRKREEEKKKQQELEEKKQIAQERQQQWLEEKVLKLKLRRASEKREKRIKAEIEEEKAVKLKTDTDINFKQWKEKLEERERQQQIKEKEKQEEEKQIKEEKRKAAEKKFEQWLQNNKPRLSEFRKIKSPTPSYVNPIPWVGPDQDASRRRPHSSPKQPTGSAGGPRRLRAASFSANRCSTPKPQSRRPETHSAMRTGRAPSQQPNPPLGLVRTFTPLRFAGIRSKTPTDLNRRSVKESGKNKADKKKMNPPCCLSGIQSSVRRESAKCRRR